MEIDDALYHQLTEKLAWLEHEYYTMESTHRDLSARVVIAMQLMGQENEICLNALQEILEVKTGVLTIAAEAVKRIEHLRQQRP